MSPHAEGAIRAPFSRTLCSEEEEHGKSADDSSLLDETVGNGLLRPAFFGIPEGSRPRPNRRSRADFARLLISDLHRLGPAQAER